MNEKKSLFSTLWDFSFNEFITIKFIKILYAIGIFFSALFSLFIIIMGLIAKSSMTPFLIIIAPINFIFWVLVIRLWLELVVVIFRIEEHMAQLQNKTNKN